MCGDTQVRFLEEKGGERSREAPYLLDTELWGNFNEDKYGVSTTYVDK